MTKGLVFFEKEFKNTFQISPAPGLEQTFLSPEPIYQSIY